MRSYASSQSKKTSWNERGSNMSAFRGNNSPKKQSRLCKGKLRSGSRKRQNWLCRKNVRSWKMLRSGRHKRQRRPSGPSEEGQKRDIEGSCRYSQLSSEEAEQARQREVEIRRRQQEEGELALQEERRIAEDAETLAVEEERRITEDAQKLRKTSC